MTEAQLSKKIIEYANSLPSTFAWKYPGTGLGISGLPDIFVVSRGRLLPIECKRPGKYESPRRGLTENQNQRIKQLYAAGVCTLVTDDLTEAKEWLDVHCSA